MHILVVESEFYAIRKLEFGKGARLHALLGDLVRAKV